jgi:muramoyltetrapeptide carboxypeptidase
MIFLGFAHTQPTLSLFVKQPLPEIMKPSRREFITSCAAAAFVSQLPFDGAKAQSPPVIVKPRRIKEGDTVGLINPAGALFISEELEIVTESLSTLGLKTKLGKHALDRYGYLAGTDESRATDVNAMFEDRDVNAVLCVRGGWGCNRILPLIKYEVIKKNPKPIIGYSDITSLLIAMYARTGLITFHGPVGISTWNQFSLEYFKKILFDSEMVTMQNPKSIGDNLAQTKDRVETITSGKARGRLVGGNLSVLAAMVGSDFLPLWKNSILFLEDDNEQIYRVDRMLTQLKLAGILRQLSGFVFGKCTKCDPGDGYGSLTLEEVLNDHIKPLGIPAWYGAMIGHIENKFTVPVGCEAEIDADAGTIRMLESATS